MRNTGSLKPLTAAVLAAVLAGGTAQAAEPEELDGRVERLERLMQSRGLVDMQMRLESLQREMQSLRGQLEEVDHMLEEMRRRQRDLYLDIDRRMVQLERSAPASGPAPDADRQAAAPQGAETNPVEEQRAYEKAFDQLRDLRYEQAIQSFEAFLEAYPEGRYAHIAQYWVAEANYAQRRFEEAIRNYQALLDTYTQSPKRAEAMLKIGYSHYELGETEKAKSVLQALEREYGGTTEAGQAGNLLQKMRQSSS